MSDTSLDDYYWQYLLSEGLELDRLYGGGHQLISSSTAALSDYGYDDSSPLSAGDNSPAAAVSGRNDDVRERSRGRTLNDKLYALRSVVPNITKMDKASVIKDAIDHIQQLQEEERRMLAEVSVLESAARTHCRLLGTAASGAIAAALLPDGCGDDSQTAVPPTKKVRRAQSFSSSTATPASSAAAASSPPVEALVVRVTATEDDKTLLVSVACRHRRDAIAVVCRALEGLGLPVVAATVTSASGTVMHTALVKREEIHESEMKEMIETAIAHLDVVRSP